MTDDAVGATNTESDPACWAAWLAGDSTDRPEHAGSAHQTAAVVRAIRDRIERDPAIVPGMLERLATVEDARVMLKPVLADCWELISQALPVRPRRSRSKDRARLDGLVSDALSYLVLSLVPTVALDLDSHELGYLMDACGRDINLLRHVLAWAASQHEVNERAQPYEGVLPAFDFVADQLPGVFAGRSRPPSTSTRVDERRLLVGGTLARQVARHVDLDVLTQYAREYFDTPLDVLIELDKLGPGYAHAASMDQNAIDEFIGLADGITINLNGGKATWYSDKDRFFAALQATPVTDLERRALTTGWAVGVTLHRRGHPRTTDSVADVLEREPSEVAETHLCEVALLWADVQQLVDYTRAGYGKHRDQIDGVRARLSKHLESSPQAWALSARDILVHADTVGRDVVDLLALGAAQHGSLRTALDEIAINDEDRDLRDCAQGLLARVAGERAPRDGFQRWLADSAARTFDGVPLFPNPLTTLSVTWLGAADLESTLTRSIRQAMTYFGEGAEQQGSAGEDHLTPRLLTELEAAFRGTSLRLAAAGHGASARRISVQHRPVSPTTEEPQWGCDVALVLKADLRPSVYLELAELVQIKKSEAFREKSDVKPTERWRIDVPQLTMLLDRSESAAYWLVLSSGELVCVTARWLQGLGNGREALNQKSFTVGYHEIRHAAVPMEQFVAELFLGTWLGSARADTLAFARGEESTIKPRYVFEIAVTDVRQG